MFFLAQLSTNYFLQYCHVSVYIPFGLTCQLHSQTICFTISPFSPRYLHKGDSHGLAVNMVSVTWLVLRACSWPAQLSASVWIFNSAFRYLLQVSLTCVVLGISLKNWPCSLFSFQLSSFSSLFQDVLNSFLLTVSSLLILPVTITLCSKTSKEFLTYHSKLFSPLLTRHSQLISRPNLHPPLIQPFISNCLIPN